MAKTDVFYFELRGVLLMTFFSGTFIPGLNVILPKRFPTLYLFSASSMLVLFNTVDHILMFTLKLSEIDPLVFYIMIAGIIAYSMVNVTGIYILFHRKDMLNFISTWSNDFLPELWPEVREDALRRQKQKSWKLISQCFLFYLLPNAILGAVMIFNGTMMVGSVFASGHVNEPHHIVTFMQFLSYWFWLLRFTMIVCFFYTLLRLILAELDYMEECIQQLFATIEVRRNGTIFCSSDLNTIGVELKGALHRKMCHLAEKRLFKLIKYHTKVLKFARQVSKIIAPIFSLLFFFVSMFVSILVYIISTGEMHANLAQLAIPCLGYWGYLCFLICTVGGEVHEKSSRLMNAAFNGNWMAYSVRTRKSLIPMIVMANQRPIVFNHLGILPMLPKTFFTLATFQYKAYQFFRETIHF